MAERNVILEGPVKFRLKKKWKSRWCILKKLSPVAGRCLFVFVRCIVCLCDSCLEHHVFFVVLYAIA
ncbi:hypothetical protein LSAT2_004504 [Lamellibrachia satsuma]|nr:hypothetical protein LSAT2_004504 [Lamellibrachia satsuma]